MTDTGVAAPSEATTELPEDLHEAVASGSTNDVQLLIREKANVDAVDSIGRTPLFVACQNASAECAALLLVAGANANHAINTGAMPLFTSAQNGHFDCIKLLLWAGADVRWCATNDGSTPLWSAVANGHVECARLLVDAQADVDAAKGDTSPLFISAANGDAECVELLLSANADPARARTSGATPLLASCVDGNVECVKLLLEARAPTDMARVNNEYTPLCVCAVRGHNECLALLLAGGADIEHGRGEATPLKLACEHGWVECVRILLSAQADTTATADGTRAIDVARSKGQMACVAMLELHALHLDGVTSPGEGRTRGATAWARHMLAKPVETLATFSLAPDKYEFGLALRRAEAFGTSPEELRAMQAEADGQRTASDAARRLAEEGRACVFLFIDASKLRTVDDSEMTKMPSLRDLSLHHSDWLVPKEVRLSDACNGVLVESCLAVSHRWEAQSYPDPTGEQLRCIRAYLNTEAGLRIALVWYSYSCMPLPSRPERWQSVAHTRHELAALKMQLPSVSTIFLGCSVLILLDEPYFRRFWPQLEAWLAMRCPSAEGLIPKAGRLTIMPIHDAPSYLDDSLIEKWVTRSAVEAHVMLQEEDVLVADERDREEQLRRLLEVDVQVRAHAPISWPSSARSSPVEQSRSPLEQPRSPGEISVMAVSESSGGTQHRAGELEELRRKYAELAQSRQRLAEQEERQAQNHRLKGLLDQALEQEQGDRGATSPLKGLIEQALEQAKTEGIRAVQQAAAESIRAMPRAKASSSAGA